MTTRSGVVVAFYVLLVSVTVADYLPDDQSDTELDAIKHFHDDVDSEIRHHFEIKGIRDLARIFRNANNRYKGLKKRLAITGEVGSGKSSLINSLRGLGPNDPGAAKTGVIETTIARTHYYDPSLPEFVFFDVPGVNTNNFPQEKYLELIHFDQYDFIIICSQSRFKYNDFWLAKEAQMRNIPYVFVRTKIDLDANNTRKSLGHKTNAEKQMLNIIRGEIKGNLQSSNLPAKAIFLISTWLDDRTKWDFEEMQTYILETLPKRAEEKYIASLVCKVLKLVLDKKEELKNKIDSSVSSALITEVLFSTGYNELNSRISVYTKAFGIEDYELSKLSTGKVIFAPASKLGLSGVTGYFLGPLIGVISYVAHGVYSYATSGSPFTSYLENALEECVYIVRGKFREEFGVTCENI